ncbi:MAG: hypothetical protein C4538_09085 [Nitrospiraceae bacterium]|nr:MAG: hypothetical protein C4538_09085 [Nitrospiraceae bacterium]
MKKILIVLLTAIFMLTSAAAFAKEKPEPEEIIGDLVLLRPLGFVSFVVGTAVFIVALPVALTTKSTKQTADVLVKKPFDYTFTRPLGETESGL